MPLNNLYPPPLPGTFQRPLIDLDLGRACQYGYRTWPTKVVHHDAAPEFDLREARLAAGMYQATVATLLGASQMDVSRWETGAVPCPTSVRAQWRELCKPRGQRALE